MTRKMEIEGPHMFFAVAVSGGMALALACGLQFLGIMGRMDLWLLGLMNRTGLSEPKGDLPMQFVWLASAILAFLLASAMLNVSGTWRRAFLWVITMVLTMFWVPVVFITSHRPEISIVLVAVFWSGFCAMVYASNHVMPVDRIDMGNRKKEKHGTS